MANVFIDENTLIAIADAIRAKTGNTDKMLPKDMSVAIDSITVGGGGSSNDVRYVTFMNGNTVLYVKPVAVGDDCVNVLTKGFIETPTKESTVDTVYTYSGWSLTDGGSTDTTNALANVTEDRTVYASYTESVRYYTVNFYDGETLLKTEQVAYGGSSTYTYAKDNHVFNGWNPEPINITGDLDCYGAWEELMVIASGTFPTNNKANWTLLPDYILVISGTGEIKEISAFVSPWNSYQKQITSVEIQEGITSIGDRLFYFCTSLTSITIPSSVTSIGDRVFVGCKGLTSITVDENNGFYCSLDDVLFNKTKTELICYSASKTASSYIVPDGVTSISDYAFSYCTNLTSITIPSSVTSMGMGVFEGCTSLTSITIPSSVTSISNGLFRDCTNLTSITIPSSITSISDYVFQRSGLTTAIFEDTEGWTAGSTALSSSDLADSTTAATYLKTTYVYQTWTKS